jgi:hypothetical protein
MKAKDSDLLRYAVITVTKPRYNNTEISNETQAKVDVYDYAAQFNVIPEITSITVPHRENGRKPAYYARVTVEGTNVVGEAYHAGAAAFAEASAYINFKKEAEKAHQGEQMLVKHINTLTSKTGEKFLKFCKIKHKDWEQYKFVSNVTGNRVLGQLFLGDRLLSECTAHS